MVRVERIPAEERYEPSRPHPFYVAFQISGHFFLEKALIWPYKSQEELSSAEEQLTSNRIYGYTVMRASALIFSHYR